MRGEVYTRLRIQIGARKRGRQTSVRESCVVALYRKTVYGHNSYIAGIGIDKVLQLNVG